MEVVEASTGFVMGKRTLVGATDGDDRGALAARPSVVIPYAEEFTPIVTAGLTSISKNRKATQVDGS
jgi:hypothetical protein